MESCIVNSIQTLVLDIVRYLIRQRINGFSGKHTPFSNVELELSGSGSSVILATQEEKIRGNHGSKPALSK
jgi:hypothetical protein